MGPLAQSVRELKIPPDLSAFTPPATGIPPDSRADGEAWLSCSVQAASVFVAENNLTPVPVGTVNRQGEVYYAERSFGGHGIFRSKVARRFSLTALTT